jgi:hypothetical protein
MNCSKVEELEESYLLGELEEEEAASVEQHLQECTTCNTRLSAKEEVLGKLFAAVEPIAPPARAKSALMTKIGNLQAATPAATAPAPVIAIAERRRKRSGWPGIEWVAAVAAALVLALGLWVFSLQGDLAETNSQRIEAQRLLEYTSASDTLIWTMLSPSVDRNAPPNLDAPRARMYIRPGSDYFVVTASKLAAPENGKAYQVWMIRNQNGKPGDKTEYVTKLVPDQQGRATAIVPNPSHSADIGSCFVTEENGEPAQPNGAKLLVWNQS